MMKQKVKQIHVVIVVMKTNGVFVEKTQIEPTRKDQKMDKYYRNCVDCKKKHAIIYIQEYANGLYGYTCQECVDKEKEGLND